MVYRLIPATEFLEPKDVVKASSVRVVIVVVVVLGGRHLCPHFFPSITRLLPKVKKNVPLQLSLVREPPLKDASERAPIVVAAGAMA